MVPKLTNYFEKETPILWKADDALNITSLRDFYMAYRKDIQVWDGTGWTQVKHISMLTHSWFLRMYPEQKDSRLRLFTQDSFLECMLSTEDPISAERNSERNPERNPEKSQPRSCLDTVSEFPHDEVGPLPTCPYVMGFFIGNGFCGIESWQISECDCNVLPALQASHPHMRFYICQGNILRLHPEMEEASKLKFISEWNAHFLGSSQSVRIPSCILGGDLETVNTFLAGLKQSWLYHRKEGYFATPRQNLLQGIYFLLRRLGKTPCLREVNAEMRLYPENKPNLWQLLLCTPADAEVPVLRRVRYAPFLTTMYTIQTESGSTALGIGRLVARTD